MRRGFTLRSLKSWLFAAVACGVVGHALAQAQVPVRIMPLGDSITAGPGCWRAFLWNQLQITGYTNIDFVGGVADGGGCNSGFTYDFDHEGHSGFSATGIADNNQLPPWLSASRPDIVIMHLGTNDMWAGFIPLQNKLTAITKLVGQMRASNANMKIVVAQIIPMSPSNCPTCAADVVAFNNALPNWAAGLTTAQSPIFLADVWTGFDVVADTYDGVHPVTSGFVKMANRFFPVVAQALNTGSTANSLIVTKSGAGGGTVTSAPAGISCGTICSASFTNGTSVTLSAAASSGSTFAGWNAACSGTGACVVSMTAARMVTATFNSGASFALSITRAGAGTGTVTSTPAGINCGTTCTADYMGGTSVTLSAAPMSGSTFAGWSGACTGTANCVLPMTQARSVTATFNTSGGTGGPCANPITFSGNTGNLNTTGAACYRTNATINGWGCYNFDGRTLTVSGVARTCGEMPLTRAADGYYYFAVTAGQFPWAGIFSW
jgi:lysophospholipase L1-like esterase